MSFNESIIEDAALEWFGDLGYVVGHGPHLAPGETAVEPDSFSEVVLVREAVRRMNPAIPEEACEEALLKVLRVSARQNIVVIADEEPGTTTARKDRSFPCPDERLNRVPFMPRPEKGRHSDTAFFGPTGYSMRFRNRLTERARFPSLLRRALGPPGRRS